MEEGKEVTQKLLLSITEPHPAKYKQDANAVAQKSVILFHILLLGWGTCPVRDRHWCECDHTMAYRLLYKTYLQYCVLQLEAA